MSRWTVSLWEWRNVQKKQSNTRSFLSGWSWWAIMNSTFGSRSSWRVLTKLLPKRPIRNGKCSTWYEDTSCADRRRSTSASIPSWKRLSLQRNSPSTENTFESWFMSNVTKPFPTLVLFTCRCLTASRVTRIPPMISSLHDVMHYPNSYRSPVWVTTTATLSLSTRSSGIVRWNVWMCIYGEM